MGMNELLRDIQCGVAPDSESAAIARTPRRFAVYIAAIAMASSVRPKRVYRRWSENIAVGSFSASRQMRSIAATALAGYLPVAVSADSITAAVPSSTALATSNTSARVGIGFSIIDSIICVAV